MPANTNDPPLGYTDEAHPEVFQNLPPRSNPRKPGQLTDAQMEKYMEDGFLLVENFFTNEELDAVREDITKLVDNLANKLYAAGKIKNKYEDVDVSKRLILIDKEFPGANIIILRTQVMPESFRRLAGHERMVNLMEDFLGPDIAFNAVWNLRSKTPANLATTVPWHQDNAYYDNRSYKALVMTAWIPLLSTNRNNGTLQFVRGAHKSGKIATHTCCDGPTWYVMLEGDEVEKTFECDLEKDVVTVDVPYGSFILFNNFIPHRSLMNNSDITRWSLDLRWQRTKDPDFFWGLKMPCEVRRSGEPDFKPDWDAYDGVNRNAVMDDASQEVEDSEFNMIMTGPWMQKWHIVHHNHHTEKFEPDPVKWDPNVRG